MGLPRKYLIGNVIIIIIISTLLMNLTMSFADAREDLELLRDRCLYYSIGHAPNDLNSKTIRYGLYAQSPFSVPASEIDIAASGFSLAALPSAVENGLISKTDAEIIAKGASQRIVAMVNNSARAATAHEYEKYGYKGMLYHYYIWSDSDNEFQGKSGIEVSSIDTVLLMFGLLICGNYFKGDVWNDYKNARDLIDWSEWLDKSTPDHMNQFRMSYKNSNFSENWWDGRSEETSLICLFATMTDCPIYSLAGGLDYYSKSMKIPPSRRQT